MYLGELPDIQIKYMDLLVPLQALGCNDNEIARLLHTKVVVSIANDAQRNGRMVRRNYCSRICNELIISYNIFARVITTRNSCRTLRTICSEALATSHQLLAHLSESVMS